jgi:hypothetical protein
MKIGNPIYSFESFKHQSHPIVGGNGENNELGPSWSQGWYDAYLY